MSFAGLWADGPVFAACFAPSAAGTAAAVTEPLVLYSGGGGSSKSGVSNFVALAQVGRETGPKAGNKTFTSLTMADTGSELCGAISVARIQSPTCKKGDKVLDGALIAVGAFSARVRLMKVSIGGKPSKKGGDADGGAADNNADASIELLGDLVLADEADKEVSVPSANVRRKSKLERAPTRGGEAKPADPPIEAETKTKLALGDAVEVLYRGKWMPAKIEALNTDGTYDVRYDKGDAAVRLNRRSRLHSTLRPSSCPRPTTHPPRAPKSMARWRGCQSSAVVRRDDSLVVIISSS